MEKIKGIYLLKWSDLFGGAGEMVYHNIENGCFVEWLHFLADYVNKCNQKHNISGQKTVKSRIF